MNEAELEASRLFDSAMAPKPEDEALRWAAVNRAMARLGEGRAAPVRKRWFAPVAVWFGALVGAGAVAGILMYSHAHPRRTVDAAPQIATVPGPKPIVLSDGSEIAPDGAAAAIQVAEQTPSGTTVRLPSGAARFHVRHDSRRLFRVFAGPFEIQDLGTIFHVAHEGGGRIRVSVSEGRVAVRCPSAGLDIELGAGDDRVLSPVPLFRAASERPSEPRKLASLPAAARSLARAPVSLRDDAAALLTAADDARKAHDPEAAVPLLRRLVDRYPSDPRASSAAFTLGWVLQTDLRRPREAASAFAQAERLARGGALAEDAAARVAEAWQEAGDARRAAAAARHYARLYPGGHSIVAMRGLAGAH